jgi:outer membrane biosynthesis protein TonB
MFKKNKAEERRQQIIDKNPSVADRILGKAPLAETEEKKTEPKPEIEEKPKVEPAVTDKPKNDSKPVKDETPIEEELKEKTESAAEPKAEETKPLKLSFFKKEKIAKRGQNYYIETAINDIIEILAVKTKTSRSEIANLFLKTFILTSEDLQELAKTDKDIQNILERLKLDN